MKTLKFAKLAAVFAAALIAANAYASALITKAAVYGTDLIAGAIPTMDVYMHTDGAQWISQTGVISAGTPWSAGMNGGGSVYSADLVFRQGYFLKNASCRGTIGQSSSMNSIFDVSTDVSSGFSVTIWGPTLNNYGLTGATNFTWYVLTSTDGSNYSMVQSGNGEVNNYVVPGNPVKIFIIVNPNVATNGTVLAQVNSRTNP